MIAIDFETSWTKDRSIATHGTVGYLRHPETDVFMVSIYDADSGLSFVGDPVDAPWEQLRGQPLCAHNWSFDSAVIAECERRGIIPFPLEPKGFCTADLVSYLQGPRSLMASAKVFLGLDLDKTMREAFKGKDYRTLPRNMKEQIAMYALGDAKACWMLWKKLGHLWPEHEQALSQHTSMMGQRGVCMDAEGVEAGARKLKQILFDTGRQIPWIDEHPATSPIQLRNACMKAGIPAPESTAKNDEGFIKWAATYAEKAPFVGAVAKYRSTNRTLAVLEAMQSRYVDGRLRYGLKYFGANHTGRWSGDSGWNAQNQPRDEVDGVDVRGLLMADPDHHLVIADYAQIEARVLLWLAGDEDQLQLIREGMCVYEAHARKTMGYTDARSLKQAAKDDPAFFKLRQYSKARCLSGDTLVLTQRGYVEVCNITLDDLLWDGVEWVAHGGVICTGVKKTLDQYGDQFTEDHELFTSNETTENAGARTSAVDGFRQRCSPRNEIRELARAVIRVYSEGWVQAYRLFVRRMRTAIRGLLGQPQDRQDKPMQPLWAEESEADKGFSQVGAALRCRRSGAASQMGRHQTAV